MRVLIGIFTSTLLAVAQGVWETRAPFPIEATEVSSAVLNGKIYTVCGLISQGRNNEQLFIYDPRTDSWTTGANTPIPGGGDHCNFAAANGKLYLLGAIRVGSTFIDGGTYEYDPAANRWSKVADMNTPRGSSGVAVIGNRIYVAGGIASSGSVANFDVFDTETRTWTRLPNMPTARDHLTAQAIGGKLYAIAGRAGRDFDVNEEFDPATNTWRTRAPIPTARGGLGSGVLNGRIQVFGGEGNSGTPQGTFRQNEEYDPAANEWRTLAPMPTPRHGLYGATFEGRIFTPSGGPVAGANFSSVHEAFYFPPAQPPAIAQEGVRNAASFEPVLAPGTLVSLFGERLSFGEQVAARLPLPARMNAITVEVNATPVPLVYTGPNQINFLLPENLPVGNASIKVTNAGSESNILTASIDEAAPGIFMLDQQGQGAVLIGGTGLIARPAQDARSRPAKLGEVIEIYGTGLGRIDAAVVSVGGISAEVLYNGPAPGFPGLFQVNARISRNVSTGNTVPVTVRAGLRTSNTVTIAVSE